MSDPATSIAIESITTTSAAVAEKPFDRVVRYLLIALAVGFLALFVVLPIANVFHQALSKGFRAYISNFVAPPPVMTGEHLSRVDRRIREHAIDLARGNWSAIRMTLGIAAIAVPLNVVFGLAAAWAIAKFRFKGRALLISLIDLPFSVSPVVAGLMFVLLFGRSGLLGNWAMNFAWSFPSPTWRGFIGHAWPFSFEMMHYRGIVFTPLAMVLATTFVTFPFVARTLIPLMETQGTDDELAALTLGANGFQMFRRVSMPNIKWGVLYGVILCNARAMGEFGAVSVVAGSVDANNTIPLRVENLYFQSTAEAFGLASVLTVLAVVTLVVKGLLELKTGRAGGRH